MFSKSRLDDIRWMEIRMKQAKAEMSMRPLYMPRERKLTAQDMGKSSCYIAWDAEKQQFYLLSPEEQEDFEREVYTNFPT